jgi:alpha-L-fucosidase
MPKIYVKIVTCLLISLAAMFNGNSANAQAPTAISPLPTEHQLELMKMETYAFIHFGPNTFQNQEWGYGNADTKIFNPTTLDCDQWVSVLKAGGMKGIIFTAKHHDGFCMWPSKFTDYSIKYSPYKNGYGDAVSELDDACKRNDMKFGIYLSPWDRHKASYGSDGYVEYYKNQLKELLLTHKDLFEIWFDGANGGDGYYGGANTTRQIDRQKYYDFPTLFSIVNELQPQIIIHSDGGPGNRWVGNEDGVAGQTNWAFLTEANSIPAGINNYETVLGQGEINGTNFIPAEVDVSIRRPDWFWSTTNSSKVLTSEELVDIYYTSVGRNATLLLNVPVNIYGKIDDEDAKALADFRKIIDRTFESDLLKDATVTASNTRSDNFAAKNVVSDYYDSYWATTDDVTSGTLTFTFDKATEINRFMIQEYIPLGQRIKAFKVEYTSDGTNWKDVNCGESTTTVGYKRLLRFSTVSATGIRLRVTEARGTLCINRVAAYCYKQID